MCLGETIRVSTTLHSLRMEGASRLSEILPGKSINRKFASETSPLCTIEIVDGRFDFVIPGANSFLFETFQAHLKSFCQFLPAIIGAGESRSLQLMCLSSPRLSLEDGAIEMIARSLANCQSLRLLILDGWSFRVEVSFKIFVIEVDR